MPKTKKPPPKLKKPSKTTQKRGFRGKNTSKTPQKQPISPPKPVIFDPASTARGEKNRDYQTAWQRENQSAARDIGAIPDIEDIGRREACRDDFRLFCDTYNPEAFTLGWSEDQLNSVARIEEAVKLGALYAMAEARGNGKSTRCRMAALWAASYALRRYIFLIGATDGKAAETLDALKMFMRFLPVYAADFPEIAYPIRRLDGIANRARGQTSGGIPTMMEWTADLVSLPTVLPPSNWPGRWGLREDGMVPTSGVVIATSGLTGEGIRGSLRTLTTGEQVRPDLVLLDDPQTAQSAKSRTQNVTREELISADVLGMAGPGKTISAIMPCTVIAPGDCIDQLTNRSKHPLWRGERSGILRSMPTNLEAWDGYFEVYRRCALKEPPDYTEANEYYLSHRAVLDEGAAASWEARKLKGEVSAVQHAMNWYARDRRAFMSEGMNQPDPVDIADLVDELDADEIVKRVNGVERGVVPAECSRLTAFIDCGSSLLHYVVCAWGEQFAGAVVDYGTFPRQSRSYYAADDARPSLSDRFRGLTEDSRVYAGLKELVPLVVGKVYTRQNGGDLTVEKCLIDSGKWTKTVTQFCRQNPLAALLMPSKGWGIGPGKPPMANWARKEGEVLGDHWRVRPNTEGGYGRLCLIDTNYWKTFVAAALQAREMGGCCLQLFGTEKENAQHRLFADHLTAEYSVRTRRDEGDRRPVDVWQQRPEKFDNHWFDALVGCFVAASLVGLRWDSGRPAGDPMKPKEPRKKKKLSDIYFAKHGGR